MIFKDGIYDKLKIIAWILAPLITFLAALGEIWGIQHMVEITATLAALDALLGTLLTAWNRAYYKAQKDDFLEGNDDVADNN